MEKINQEVKIEIQEILNTEKGKTLRVSSLLKKLNFSKSKGMKFDSDPIIRLHILRRVKGINQYTKLQKYLIKNKIEALELGFYEDENNNLIIPPKRTFNNYLTQLNKKDLDELVELILSEATKNKVLLDIEIIKNTTTRNYRADKKRLEESVRFVKKMAYPEIKMSERYNSKYSNKKLLDVLCYAASINGFTNGSSIMYGDNYSNKRTPSSDAMLHRFGKFQSTDDIIEVSDNVLDSIFRLLKQEYNLLSNRKLDIAYDVHEVEYFGKNMPYVCSGKEKGGTKHFFKYLTCSIVIKGYRFILDICPIHQLDTIPKLLDKSLSKIKKKIKINIAYFDRGFDSIEIVNLLNKHKIKFLMPKVRSLTVKAWLEKTEGKNVRVINNFEIGKGNRIAKTNLILVNDKDGIKRAFSCNFPVAEPLAYRLYELYSKRWGIETSYRNLDYDFKAKTTSKNYIIRLFYFVFSTFLYNAWIMANICISYKLYGEVCKTPIIIAKRFVNFLYQVKEEIDSG